MRPRSRARRVPGRHGCTGAGPVKGCKGDWGSGAGGRLGGLGLFSLERRRLRGILSLPDGDCVVLDGREWVQMRT